MDIQSTGATLTQTQEQAAIQVERIALESITTQGAALERLLESAEVVLDPTMGGSLDLLA